MVDDLNRKRHLAAGQPLHLIWKKPVPFRVHLERQQWHILNVVFVHSCKPFDALVVSKVVVFGQLAGIIAGRMQLGQGRTVEELVQELLRPLLREWLDKNLPELVDELVKKEIERMVEKANR